jgi:hypothetical protein
LDTLRTRQIASISGHALSNQGITPGGGLTSGSYLGSFHGNPGNYNLEIEVLSPTKELDHCQPQLLIEASWQDFERSDSLLSACFFLSAVSVFLGISLVLISVSTSSITKSFEDSSLRIFHLGVRPAEPDLPPLRTSIHEKPAWGITGLRYRRRSSPRSPWATNPVMNIPTVSLVCSLVWFVWLMPTWLLYENGQYTRKGLFVSLLRKDVPPSSITSGLAAPLVKIDANRAVYLNYKQTTWRELPSALDRALAGLPQRVVYFDADLDVPFMDAAHAIDMIVGANARAILMTPKSRPPQPRYAPSPSRSVP